MVCDSKFIKITILMSNNLVPIRKFSYIFDRRHFGMIGTVTQCDTSLGWGGNSKGPSRRGKLLTGGHKSSREVALSNVMDMTGLPTMPVRWCLVCRVLTSQDLSHPVLKTTAVAYIGWI